MYSTTLTANPALHNTVINALSTKHRYENYNNQLQYHIGPWCDVVP